EAAFQAAVTLAATAAEQGKLVTFGIKPTAPETGYGYIKAGAGTGASAVERFVEKPDLATAQSYLASGEYYWNSGMFLFRASRYLEELRKFHPAIADACQKAWENGKRDADFTRLDKDAFAASPSDSIDYAVMEKTADAVVVPLDAGWNDVGSWSSLLDVSSQDAQGNAHHGDVIQLDCQNTYAYGSRLIAMVGLEDVVVVETPDAVLVGHRDRIQEVKDVVSQIKTAGRSEATWHRKVYRPWGAYDSIDMGQRHQVKRITVKPGAVLSLQMHHHRAEHWIVVSGTAEVTRGEEVLLLTENQSTYIPLGVTHRLRNPGKLPLELIEVQSGSYLGEDDIVRFEDTYGRA
ncbi:mannose-1-phosphate guanylyltransferase/mannose-6-phosphate isomerase, partial [Xanthomonas perforans]